MLDLLYGFEEVTRLLSGAKYCTISSMYLAILALIASFKDNQTITPITNFKLDSNNGDKISNLSTGTSIIY